ncbi:MAG: ABC transporter ATP-binding protein [Actinobacteria bacterium]|nr:ABC transporter ATP-binding protein [Actinomycetota bacterium]
MNIVFESVSKSFGRKKALNNVSFRCTSGEVIGFVGPNGAGKTTTMRLMLGFIYPDSGKITYDGVFQDSAIPYIRKNFGYLPENNPLPEEMIVADYLEYHARSKGVKNEVQRVKELSKELDFKEYLLQPISNLSKGYKQRVGLAAALISDPEVLVLDEPQEGLDPYQRIEIRELIRDLGKKRTVILSTHILTEVVETCKRIILINQGEVILDEDISAALKRFSTKSFYALVKGVNVLEAFRQRFGNEKIEHLEDKEGAKLLRIWSEKDIREEVFKFCVENQFVLLELSKESPTLEQVFLKLTEKAR